MRTTWAALDEALKAEQSSPGLIITVLGIEADHRNLAGGKSWNSRLSEINPPDPGFPHSFWNDYVRRDLIFGKKVDDLQMR